MARQPSGAPRGMSAQSSRSIVFLLMVAGAAFMMLGGRVQRLYEEFGVQGDGYIASQDEDSVVADRLVASEGEQRHSVPETKLLSDAGTRESRADGKHALSKELVEPLLRDNYLLVTWANWHYRDFVNTWVHNLRKVGCENFIVGAMDDQLLDWLLEHGIPTFSMQSGLPSSDFGWGSKNFHKMGREKINLLHAFVSLGINVLISDVDVVWMRNPIEYMERYPEADVLVSSDSLDNDSPTEALESVRSIGGIANIGIILLRPSQNSKAFAEEWVKVLDEDPNYWDQNAFNDLLRKGGANSARKDGLFEAYNKKLLAGMLPVTLFCSGQTYRERVWQRLGLHPYAVHATFQYSGTPGKRNRMREWQLWKDEPARWTHPVGFISYENQLPEEHLQAVRDSELSDNVKGTVPHFTLVNGQLKQLRNVLVVAQALGGASTIMPHMWYGHDRWWAPHDGRIPSSLIELPFQGPIDLVLDLEELEQSMPDGYREFSFLWKPEAKELNASKLIVIICKDESEEGCLSGESSAPSLEGEIRLQPQRTVEQLTMALQGVFEHNKLVHFQGDTGQLITLSKEDVDEYNSKMLSWASIYCCVHEQVGHVWYDLFWDYPGHRDRHGRVQEGEWKPLTGP